MKNFRWIAACGFAAALVATAAWAHDQEHAEKMESKASIGKTAPDFTLTDLHGKARHLSDYRGKFVVLEWNNPDCPFVNKHYGSGNMQALQREYGKKGVVWLTINSSAKGKQGYYEPAALEKWLGSEKWAAQAYLRDTDGKVGRLYGAKTTPNMFVIDPKGTLIYAGAIDDKPSTKKADVATAKNYVRACLDAAMAGKTVAVHATVPYGCSVKYAK